MKVQWLVVATLILWAPGGAAAQEVAADLNRISSEGVGEKIGTVTLSDGQAGLSVKVEAGGIPAGEHGFHVHENGDCGPGEKDGKRQAGIAAGDHYDPQATKSHQGPQGAGHKGDMPKLAASADGIAATVEVPRLTLDEVRGRSLIIHEGSDTYSDEPESGGGEGRIACAVIPAQ